MTDQRRATRHNCKVAARIHLATGGLLKATVVNISESGALIVVSNKALGIPAADTRTMPSRFLTRLLTSDFIVQLWSPSLEQWAASRIVSKVRTFDRAGEACVAAAFGEPLSEASLAALGVDR